MRVHTCRSAHNVPPGMHHRLRERFPSALLPIIMISAKGGESDVIAALRCGADDYLTKPYRSAELLERVKAHMRVSDRQGDSFLAHTRA